MKNFESTLTTVEEVEHLIECLSNAESSDEGLYVLETGVKSLKVIQNVASILGLFKLFADPYENLSVEGFSNQFSVYAQEIRMLADDLCKIEPMYGTKTTFNKVINATMNTDVSIYILAEVLSEGGECENRIDSLLDNTEKLCGTISSFLKNGKRRLKIN
ncbi:MAG: hypothetical protein ACQEU4_07615 [Bacillota bacterium]